MAQTTLRASLEQLSDQIEKVGQSLGRNPFYIFRTLTLPAILPGVAAAFALVFEFNERAYRDAFAHIK